MYPQKKNDKNGIKFHSKPWINPKIQRLIKYREKLLPQLKRNTPLTINNLYKKFRNRFVNELKTSKINYYNQYFTEHKNNMKMLWSGIRSIINVKNNRLNNTSQTVQNGKVIKNPLRHCTGLQSIFCKYCAKY